MEDIILADTRLTLLADKAIWWKEESSLFLSDLHFGKTSHFRKEGIAIPHNLIKQDFERLHKLLINFNPNKIYLLGDLFHSDYNTEWELVKNLFSFHNEKVFHLIIGNHDILDKERYLHSSLFVHTEKLELDPFILTHEPLKNPHRKLYNLCGHIHPAVLIKGKGRQSHRLPCFFKSQCFTILPAFGTFTGLKTLKMESGEKAFVIVNDEIIEIQSKFSKGNENHLKQRREQEERI